jgi:hypothetical protein
MSTGVVETPRTRAGARAAATTRRPAARPVGTRPAADTADPPGGTAPFVLLIMVLLTAGLVTTLWLSTAAAADSYRLDGDRQVARDLSEQSERLHRDVEAAQPAPALAAAARAQGMVPAGDPAVLLVAPDGSSQVIGNPQPALAPPPPVPVVTAPVAPAPPAAAAASSNAAAPPTTTPDGQPTPGSPTAPTEDAQGAQAAQAASNGAPAPAPAGAAAAEDQVTAVTPGTGG